MLGSLSRVNKGIPQTIPARLVYLVTAGLVALTILFLTLLKSSFSIGGLWNAAAHNRRSIDLIPFNGFIDPPVWYGPITNTLGNAAMFVPVGVLVVLLWGTVARTDITARASRRRVLLRVALIGGMGSLAIEVAQFVFARGYSDVDDLILNTAGATLGAWLTLRLNAEGRRYVLGLIWASCLVILVMMFAGALFD
ncbi:hypothetical protein A605_13765 [Corynebacterium halotolerans YIM 70093 = DSM 44683]|uniref:VanZ-like domain-containing protein n=1 Tax=Corynebacterium halotolerans YIM 70093 = DSM 44683 TaxID=1121362 RepID=M1N1E9_9CORY|nr:hypothetical protein A605_13765 [Corynebacterium halotolerans YIM 70093 = DSM 44683]